MTDSSAERSRRVVGIGGIFIRARDPDALRSWYRTHLGLDIQEWGGVAFQWDDSAMPNRPGATVWSIFPESSKYFDPSPAPCMINYRVPDLGRVLQELRAEGCAVDERTEESEFGKFGWVMDPEGNRIELWEPRSAGFRVEGFRDPRPTPPNTPTFRLQGARGQSRRIHLLRRPRTAPRPHQGDPAPPS